MKILLYILAAVCGYVIAGMNSAIALSKAIYKKDIRECGSGKVTYVGTQVYIFLLFRPEKFFICSYKERQKMI